MEGGTFPLPKAKPCNNVEPLTVEGIVVEVVEGKAEEIKGIPIYDIPYEKAPVKGAEGWMPPLRLASEVEPTSIVLDGVVGIEKVHLHIAKEGVCTSVESIVVLMLLTLAMKKEGE